MRFIVKIMPLFLLSAVISFSGCFGSFKKLKVMDFTNKRVTDLTFTKKVVGSSNFLFFSKTETKVFLEGYIQGIVTDYADNPIEGVTVRAISGRLREKSDIIEFDAIEESANSYINLSFTPGVSDTQGLFKIQFSLPVIDDEVDVEGKIVYNPGWQQQKINLGKTYEPQMKESSFRLYYNLDTGFLAFAEGIRHIIVQPVGEGPGKMMTLPGSGGPKTIMLKEADKAKASSDDSAMEDLFEGFDFGK